MAYSITSSRWIKHITLTTIIAVFLTLNGIACSRQAEATQDKSTSDLAEKKDNQPKLETVPTSTSQEKKPAEKIKAIDNDNPPKKTDAPFSQQPPDVTKLASAIPADGEVFMFVNVNSGRCLGVKNGNIVQGPFPEHATPTYRWKVVRVGDHFKLVNQQTGKVLAVPAASKKEGTKLIEHNDTSLDDQQWKFVKVGDHYSIKSRVSGFVVAVGKNVKQENAIAFQWKMASIPDQIWIVRSIDDSKRPKTEIAKQKVQDDPKNADVIPKDGDDNRLLGLLLGRVSNAYKASGYKNRTLGVTHDELKKEGVLKAVNLGDPWIIRDKPFAHEEEFVFDSDKNLILYTRVYAGGRNDYEAQLIELFGSPDKQHISGWNRNDQAATTYYYHFPNVLVKVLFVTTFKAPKAEAEKTYVVVLSKPWVTKILAKNIKDKRQNLEWLQKVAESVKDGSIDSGKWPAFDGVSVRDAMKDVKGKGVPIRNAKGQIITGKVLVDEKYEKEAGSTFTATFGSILKAESDVSIDFQFNLLSRNATTSLLNARKWSTSRPEGGVEGNNALRMLTFRDELIRKLNSLLCQEYFPPKGQNVRLVAKEGFLTHYEWETEQGWRIATTTDFISIEIGKRKKL